MKVQGTYSHFDNLQCMGNIMGVSDKEYRDNPGDWDDWETVVF